MYIGSPRSGEISCLGNIANWGKLSSAEGKCLKACFLGEFDCKGTTKSPNRQTFFIASKSVQILNFLYFNKRHKRCKMCTNRPSCFFITN